MIYNISGGYNMNTFIWGSFITLLLRLL